MQNNHENMLSRHGAPRPWVRRITAVLLTAGLGFAAAACVIQVILAPVTHGWLFCGTALLTVILIIPLLLRTVLHPEITVTESGLYVQPMIWPGQFVPWRCITGITAHPLVYNDEPMGRVLHGKRYQPREGVVVVTGPDSGLNPVYRLIGSLAGAGSVPAFALSSTTHADYAALVAAIRARVEVLPS